MADALPAVVLGAGPSGLAAAACLRREGVDVTVLERADAVGSAWRKHYERLHLHTVKQHSSLPGVPFPEHVPTYPSRQDVVDYLDAYALRWGVAPRFGEEVRRVRRVDGAWEVTHTTGATRARAVVVCTGYNRVPLRPTWPGMERFRGEVIHASEYRNGRAWRGRDALVVGAGNTGAELAIDLWESGARVSLCVRGPLHVLPRDAFGIPAQVNSLAFLSKLPPRVADRIALAFADRLVGDLSPWGIRRPRTGPVSQVLEEKRVPLLDVGTVALIKQGHVRVVPGLAGFTDAGVRFEDGRELGFDVVVLATGYRTGLEDFFDRPERVLDGRGHPLVFGAESSEPGLYFVGYRNPTTGQLHDRARAAAPVAAHVAGRRA